MTTMELGSSLVTPLASRLREAADHLDAAADIKIPVMFRRDAHSRVGTQLDSARGALEDVIRGVEELRSSSVDTRTLTDTAIAAENAVAYIPMALTQSAFHVRAKDLRRYASNLDVAGNAEQALATGTGNQWIREAARDERSTAWAIAERIRHDRRLDASDPAIAFLRTATRDMRSMEAVRRALDGDLESAASHRLELLRGESNPNADEIQLTLDHLSPAEASGSDARYFGWYRDTLTTDAARSVPALIAKLDEMAALPIEDIGTYELRTISRAAQLGGASLHLPPEHGYVGITSRAARDPAVVNAVVALQQWSRANQAIEADQSQTAASRLEHVRSILAKQDQDITSADLQYVNSLDVIRAPDHSVDLPPTFAGGHRPRFASSTQSVTEDFHAQLELNHLRLWDETERLRTDDAVTRESLLADVLAIAESPVSEMTKNDVQRVAAAASLPASKAVYLPSLSDMRIAAAHGDRAHFGSVAERLRADTRLHTDPAARAEVVQQLADGRIPTNLAARLLADPLLRSKIPTVTAAELVRAWNPLGGELSGAQRTLGRQGPFDVYRYTFDLVQRDLKWIDTALPHLGGADHEPLRERAHVLVADNLDRIARTRTDGYAGHPDYSELGELRGIVATLADLTDDAGTSGAW